MPMSASAISLRAGYTVITTCSKDNFAYVKSLGAELAVDYHDADAGSRIREYTNNGLFHAWDTVSVPQSAQICADALSTQKGRSPVYGTLLPVTSLRADVETVTTVMYTVFGKPFKFGSAEIPANEEDFEFGKIFSTITEALVAEVRYTLCNTELFLFAYTLTSSRAVSNHMHTGSAGTVSRGSKKAWRGLSQEK